MSDTSDQPTKSDHVQKISEAMRLLTEARDAVETHDWALLRMAEQQTQHEAEDAERAQQIMDLRNEVNDLMQENGRLASKLAVTEQRMADVDAAYQAVQIELQRVTSKSVDGEPLTTTKKAKKK
jgi:hypothetical protein